MKEIEIINARITSTYLGFEDHGIFTYYLEMDFGASGQSFGGRFTPSNQYLRDAISRMLQVVGVRSWEELVGKPVRVRSEDERLVALGNFLEDVWYEPRKDHEEER